MNKDVDIVHIILMESSIKAGKETKDVEKVVKNIIDHL